MSQLKWEYFIPIYGDHKIVEEYSNGELTLQEAVSAIVSTSMIGGLHAGMALNVGRGSLMLAKIMPTFASALPVAVAATAVIGTTASIATTYEKKVMSKARGKSGLKVTPFGGQGFGSVV